MYCFGPNTWINQAVSPIRPLYLLTFSTRGIHILKSLESILRTLIISFLCLEYSMSAFTLPVTGMGGRSDNYGRYSSIWKSSVVPLDFLK
jgi:hypothetical protein